MIRTTAHRFAPFALALLLAAPAVSARADELSDLLARAKKAAGGEAWDHVRGIHAKAKIETGGLSGVVESWDDVATGRFAQSWDLGPAKGAEGFDGKVSWSQEPSGQVVAQDRGQDHEGMVTQAFLRSLAYFYPEHRAGTVERLAPRSEGGRRFEALRLVPAGGRPTELWLDAKTLLPDRTIEKVGPVTNTTFFTDYRDVQGLKVAFAQRTTNGEAKYDTKVAVQEIRLDASVQDARFAPPAEKTGDFEIAEGRTSASVQLRLINNHLYIEVGLNGEGPFRFLFDTGGNNILTADTVRRLGLKAEGALEGTGSGEKSEDVALVRVAQVTIGGLELRDQVFYVFPLDELEKVEGTPVAGVVGFEVIKRLVATIDYDGGWIHLTLPSEWKPPAGAAAIPFEFESQTPQIEASVDGIAGHFTVDTGSRVSLDLNSPFVAAHGLVAKYKPKVEATTGWGVGGAARSRVVRVAKLELGTGAGAISVPSVVTCLSLQKKGAFAKTNLAGNIGGGVLKRFDVSFDYGKKIMYLELNGNATAADPYDRAGFWLLRETDGTFRIADVTAGSPAARAGLKTGDLLLAIDGTKTSDLFLPDLRKRLATEPAGTVVKLEVKSKGVAKGRVVEVKLREMV